MADIDREFGRRAFGDDPANYATARPAYPDWVYERLESQCGLAPGAAVFEIGAGAGIATRELLARGASPLVAIEPDARSAAWLQTALPAATVVAEPFETAILPRGDFDLGLAATAFHWLDEQPALQRSADLLRPGGWLALVWNVFGDHEAAEDAFHDATDALLNDGPRSPSNGGKNGVPFALNVNARMSAFGRCGRFEAIGHEVRRWPLILDPDQVVALYSTYSDMTARSADEQRHVLGELRKIAAAPPFSGRVLRNAVTILYWARRRA